MVWCNDSIAIVSDYWWNNRNTKTYVFNPNNKSKIRTIFDRNYQDRYTDPGNFITQKNEMGSNVLCFKDGYLFLSGAGYSKEGQFPFINKLNVVSKEISTVYKSEYTNKLERINDYDIDKNQLLVRIESPNEYPNYFIKDLKSLSELFNPIEKIMTGIKNKRTIRLPIEKLVLFNKFIDAEIDPKQDKINEPIINVKIKL